MIADLKPYPEYKESEAPWFGDVPGHWGVKRLGSVFAERGETNEKYEVTEVLSVLKDIGVIPYSEKGRIGNKKSEDVGRYKIVRPDDLVVNCMNVIIGSVGRSRYTGCLSPVYYVLKRRQSENLPRYLELVFQHKSFQRSLVRIGNGILAHRMRIPMEKLKAELFPLPPPAEQAAIVRFLDWANGRLERTRRAKRKVIALLNEQKQAIIHRAVSHGLYPSVRLKPSGIPWLGDIPQHWEVRRVKQTTRILRGKFSHRPRNDASLYDGQYPFIQTGVVAQASKLITSYSQTLNEKGLAVSKLFPSGTLVMTIAANIGEVAVLTFDACFPDSIVGFVPAASTDRDYLYMVFLCMKPELLREAPVNTQGNLNVERIGAMGMPFPPLGEQGQIAKRAEAETEAFDSAISRLEREIELLREYRTRLVADVVTGKLDVRVAAARLPDEVAPDTVEEDIDVSLDPESPDEEAAA